MSRLASTSRSEQLAGAQAPGVSTARDPPGNLLRCVTAASARAKEAHASMGARFFEAPRSYGGALQARGPVGREFDAGGVIALTLPESRGRDHRNREVGCTEGRLLPGLNCKAVKDGTEISNQ